MTPDEICRAKKSNVGGDGGFHICEREQGHSGYHQCDACKEHWDDAAARVVSPPAESEQP